LLIAAVSVNNYAVSQQTDEHLLRLMTNDPIGHNFAEVLAAIDKNREKAEAELLYSEKPGMDCQIVQSILSMDISRNARVMRFLRRGGISLAHWLAVLGAFTRVIGLVWLIPHLGGDGHATR
jgi:hypothetical protein